MRAGGKEAKVKNTILGLIITLFSVVALVFSGLPMSSAAAILVAALFLALWDYLHEHMGRWLSLLALEASHRAENVLMAVEERAFRTVHDMETKVQQPPQEQQKVRQIALAGGAVLVFGVWGVLGGLGPLVALYAPAHWSLRLLLLSGVALVGYGLYRAMMSSDEGAAYGDHRS